MERIFSSRFFTPAFLILMAVSVIIAYSNTLTGAFQFDDIPSIVENPSVQDASAFFQTLTGPRGITLATFYLNFAMGGLDTFGYHAVNLLIHIVNGLLAYLILVHAFSASGADLSRARRLAALSVMLFTLHPIQTQAVSYIVQRMETLSALFTLASILLLIKASGQSRIGRRGFFYASIAASYVLGFYSKEIAITIPAVVFLYDLFFISDMSLARTLSRWPLYAVLSVLLAVFAMTTVSSLGGFGDVSDESAIGAVAEKTIAHADGLSDTLKAPSAKPAKEGLSAGFTLKTISKSEYMLTELNVIVYYMALIALPAYQTLDYDFPVSKGLFTTPEVNEGTALLYPIPPPVVSLVALLSLAIGAVYIFIRSGKGFASDWRIASFAFFWFLILLSPTSSFIPILDVIYEHRVYLASLGIFSTFVLAVDSICTRLSRRTGA